MKTYPPHLSIVSPVYQAQDCIDALVDAIQTAVKLLNLEYEIILVDDGSSDHSWAKIDNACKTNPRIKGIRLNRNFGQYYAITAGLASAKGTLTILLDCDLQDDPSYIPVLCAKAREGFDVVYAVKQNRQYHWMRSLGSRFFSFLFNMGSNKKNVLARSDLGTFSLLSRRTVDAFLQMKDYHRPYLHILQWLSFPSAYVPVPHAPRYSGKSSYSTARLIFLALNCVAVQSDRLLHGCVFLGLSLFILAMTATAYLIITYFLHGYQTGWTSLIVAIFGSTGMIMMSLGVLGMYVGRILDQTRGRPLYHVRESRNCDVDQSITAKHCSPPKTIEYC